MSFAKIGLVRGLSKFVDDRFIERGFGGGTPTAPKAFCSGDVRVISWGRGKPPLERRLSLSFLAPWNVLDGDKVFFGLGSVQ